MSEGSWGPTLMMDGKCDCILTIGLVKLHSPSLGEKVTNPTEGFFSCGPPLSLLKSMQFLSSKRLPHTRKVIGPSFEIFQFLVWLISQTFAKGCLIRLFMCWLLIVYSLLTPCGLRCSSNGKNLIRPCGGRHSNGLQEMMIGVQSSPTVVFFRNLLTTGATGMFVPGMNSSNCLSCSMV